MTPEEEKIAEEVEFIDETVGHTHQRTEDLMLEDTSPEGIMQNAELARQVAEEVYQADDDSDEKVDNGNYPQDMDKTLI